jgi:Cysteine-rich CPXCG
MVDFPSDDLDDELPPGDGGGTADTDGIVTCPYCGEPNEIGIDAGGGAYQDYVEDCQVCCRPWRVTVVYDDEGNAEISASPLDE